MGRHDVHHDARDEPTTPAPGRPHRRRIHRARRVEAADAIAIDTLIAHARRRAQQVALASRPRPLPRTPDPRRADPDDATRVPSCGHDAHSHRRATRSLRPGRHRR